MASSDGAATPEGRHPHALDVWRRVNRDSYSAADMPEFPARVLLSHCLAKGLEWSVLGLVAWPLWMPRFGFSAAFRRAFIVAPAVGTAGTALLLGYKAAFAHDMDDPGVDDRAYRISRSASQTAVDDKAWRWGLAGASAGAVLGSHGVASVASGAGFGIALAVAAHAAPMVAKELDGVDYSAAKAALRPYAASLPDGVRKYLQ